MSIDSIVLVSLGNGYSKGLGGGLVRTIALAKYLDAYTKFSVFLICSPGVEAYFRGLSRLSIEVRSFRLIEILRGFFSEKALLLLYYILVYLSPSTRRFEKSLIYSQTEYPWDVINAVRLSKSGDGNSLAVMFHHVVGKGSRWYWSNLFSRGSQYLSLLGLQLSASVFKLVSYNTASGDDVIRFVSSFRLKIEAVRVLNGFSDLDLQQARETSCGSLKTYDALFVGGLRQQKGLEQFEDFLSTMEDLDSSIQIAVIGNLDPKTRSIFFKFRNVSFLGGLGHVECLSYIASSRVLFSPSTAEGFGIAILEGILLSKLVVTYPLPVMIETFGADVRLASDFTGASLARAVVEAVKDSNTYRPSFEYLQARYKAYEWNNIFREETATLTK